jgi:hypothetical protein
VVIDLPRVAAILDRIAADIDELARARRVQDLDTAAVLPDPERRRRLVEPDLEFRAFCTRPPGARFPGPATGAGLGRRAGRAIPARRDQPTARRPTTRSGHANDHPMPQRTPGPFRKLDAIAVLTGPLLPARLMPLTVRLLLKSYGRSPRISASMPSSRSDLASTVSMVPSASSAATASTSLLTWRSWAISAS